MHSCILLKEQYVFIINSSIVQYTYRQIEVTHVSVTPTSTPNKYMTL